MSEPEPVWTFRGYQLKPSEFTTAMVHFFRAEISRANVWRVRLDTTTNWAVVTTGAVISFAFSDPYGFASVFVLNMLLITMFLSIEARRYRYYELWASRVRLMETDFYAAMLVPPFRPDPDWAETLADSLLQPHFSISIWEALGRRLRRNYLWIYLVLDLAWFSKLAVQPTVSVSWNELVQRASIGPVPGWTILSLGIGFNLILILIGLLSLPLQEASGEVLPRFGSSPEIISKLEEVGGQLARKQPWFRHIRHRQQLMALIITDKAQGVADAVLEEMKRGVTSLAGTGMYTGQSHAVLLCAITVTEVGQLKSLVRGQDENAFVIVTPAKEVFGKGFSSLYREEG
jgi:uncharacterized membrane protein